MKKLIVFAVLTLISFKVAAQETTTKEIEKFTEIKAFDQINVVLIKSNENKVVLTGDDQGDVDIENKKGLLKIKMDFENSMDGEDVEAKVYYTEELTLIDANEGAEITSEGTFKATEARIAVQEGGKVEMKVDIENLFVKSTSGSEITLTGSATNQEVVANAGGKVFNEKLDTETTKVTVNAGGDAEIKASVLADAKVRAGGTIAIHGNPKKIDRNKVFGGKIEVIE
ncbi:MAG: head GIN domain-containing protein [Aurantibacter sp.]